MKELMKYLGVVILLIGVIILAIPALQGTMNNTILIIGFLVIIGGYLSHIMINKKAE